VEPAKNSCSGSRNQTGGNACGKKVPKPLVFKSNAIYQNNVKTYSGTNIFGYVEVACSYSEL
jgi:hypothetical protein